LPGEEARRKTEIPTRVVIGRTGHNPDCFKSPS